MKRNSMREFNIKENQINDFRPCDTGDTPCSQHIHAALREQLFSYLSFGMLASFILSFIVFFALEDAVSFAYRLFWLAYMLIIEFFLAVNAFYCKKKSGTSLTFTVFLIALLAIGWGLLGTGFVSQDNTSAITFIAIVLFGVSAAAMPFLCTFVYIYILFLIPTLTPFILWLFYHEAYFLWEYAFLLYSIVMLMSVIFLNRFLKNALRMRHEKMDLSKANETLEQSIKKRTRKLKRSLELTGSILNSIAEGVLVVNLNGTIEKYNSKFLSIFAIKTHELKSNHGLTTLGLLAEQINLPREFLSNIELLQRTPKRKETGEFKLNHGKIIEWYSTPHQFEEKVIGRVWTFKDISSHKNMQEKLAYQANHDLLTGLPNRRLLELALKKEIAHASRFNSFLVTFFLDIDNFKLVNDSFGHTAGDYVLQVLAERMQRCIRKTDMIARFGGDEFVLLFPVKNFKGIDKLSQRLLHEIGRPVCFKSHSLHLTGSIGVSIYPKDSWNQNDLLKHANTALHLAKKLGRNTMKLYKTHLELESKELLTIQTDLFDAFRSKQLFLQYQPILDLNSGNIVAAETLIRWTHPSKGLISPDKFIPVAESSGYIVELGKWVMIEAFKQTKAWIDSGFDFIKIAINVSAIQIKHDAFISILEQSAREAGIPPESIEIEITETTLMESSSHITNQLHNLRKKGFNLVIDDFGMGFSSLSYLKRFPINKIKIDKSFVKNCVINRADSTLLLTIIEMGAALDLLVVAEGIEDMKQLKFLQEHHCSQGQGFLFSPAVDPDVFFNLLKRRKLMPKKAMRVFE